MSADLNLDLSCQQSCIWEHEKNIFPDVVRYTFLM